MAHPIRYFVLFIGAILIVTGSSVSSFTFAQCRAPGGDCDGPPDSYVQCAAASPQEQKNERKILDQLRKGVPAKLGTSSVIRGCFLRDILTKKRGIREAGIIIDGATITGPVDIRNQSVNLFVKLSNCVFQDDFVIKRTHFLKGLSLEKSCFHRLDAEDATIDFDLILDEAIFPDCPPYFKNAHIGVDLSLRGAKVSGPADFTAAVIGGSFFADPAEDSNSSTEFGGADFEGIKVGLDTGLRQARFDGKVNFSNADFNSLSIKDALFCGDVHFIGTRIHDFTLGKSPASRFKGANLKIEDMTFHYMSPEDWNELETFAEKSNSGVPQPGQDKSNSALFYASLEDLFQKHGHSEDADNIYIAWKLRERRDLHGLRKLWSYVQYKLVGYGRQKEWILVVSIPFVLVGLVVFDKRFMELKDRRDTEQYANRYCRFLYTLDLFIPIIQLGYVDRWTPSAIGSRIYKPFHILVGNLIVPIGLAAWVGIIK